MEDKKDKKKKSNKGYYLFMFIVISLFVLILWSRYVSTKGLVVREYGVINEKLPDSFHGLKVVHFTDLHYKTTIYEEELKTLVENINEVNADIVVFTGDLVDKLVEYNEEEVKNIAKYLNDINVNIGKYAIKGNHDYTSLYFDAVFESTVFKIL